MFRQDIIRKDGGIDKIEVYSVNDFPYERLNTKALNCRKKNPAQYIYDFAAFDIETTTIEGGQSYGYMYHWQMVVAGFAIIGRYWEEWLYFMDQLVKLYELDEQRHFVIYVHNLGYEFQFMRDFLTDHYGDLDVFATKSRQPIRVTTSNGLEFRCSYKLTNMSLNKATINELGVEHIKAVGDLDYTKIRTPSTRLSSEEIGYCVSDVVSLYELIKMKLHNEHDNLESIPMTSTGYVRRDCRRACRKDPGYRKLFNKLVMSVDDYTMLKEAGRGGDTHANRHLSGRIWHDLDSFDFQSDYPAQMIYRKFPMSRFTPYGEIESAEELESLSKEYALLFRITLFDVRVKEDIAMPYIPLAKCWSYAKRAEDSDVIMRCDNGRILSAPYLSITITDVDWKIIKKQYVFSSYAITDLRIATYDYLPAPIIKTVKDYFLKKTELKYKIAKTESTDWRDLDNFSYLYAKSKNRLNGIFGMCYTDPVHKKITINAEGQWIEEVPDVAEALAKYQKSRNSFLFYAWGVWVTCWARLQLSELIEKTGQHRTVYCDTDSSKAINVDLQLIDQFNEEIKKLAEERKAYADVRGMRYYMGIAEHENKKPIESFITLGAKKYCYKDEKGLHITVSGVGKQKNYETGEYVAVEELKNIENFKPGFIFRRAGGKELRYNDNVGIHEISVDGCTFLTASNVAMTDSTYTLGITGEYAEIIGYNIYYDVYKEG